jgi:hypothetical protein
MFIDKTSQDMDGIGAKARLQLSCHDDKVGEIQLF